MWPFRKSPKQPVPDHIWNDGTVARCSPHRNVWEFTYQEIKFFFTGHNCETALDSAKEVLPLIRSLNSALKEKASEMLGEGACDKSKAQVAYIELSKYLKSRKITVGLVGDESWDGVMVHVSISNGKITSAMGTRCA